MANTKTVNEIRERIEIDGYCMTPISTIEHYAGESFTDDDALETYLDSMISGVSWVTSYEVDYVLRNILFKGPKA